MTEQAAPNCRRIFTIGHSNHDEPTFVGLLEQHQIEVLADVRSQPYSKYATHFNADQIKHALAGAGIMGSQPHSRPHSQRGADSLRTPGTLRPV